MKSLNFTILESELRNKTKTQTIRTLFIPNFYVRDIVWIKFKKKRLYQVRITLIEAKRLKDITLLEARKDGFETIKECQKAVMELNGIRSLEHWSFIIQWKPLDFYPINKRWTK